MDESSLTLAQNILSLLDKVVVGVVAIAASVIAQWSSHKWSEEREQQKVLQEKAADLIKGRFIHIKIGCIRNAHGLDILPHNLVNLIQ